jgi:hypothetical protein
MEDFQVMSNVVLSIIVLVDELLCIVNTINSLLSIFLFRQLQILQMILLSIAS